MKKLALIIPLLVGLVGCTLGQSTDVFSDAYLPSVYIDETGSGTVVKIEDSTEPGRQNVYVLTAFHVSDKDELRISIPTYDSRGKLLFVTDGVADKIESNEEKDVSVVRIQVHEGSVSKIAHIKTGHDMKVGSTLYSVGCPFGSIPIITDGILGKWMYNAETDEYSGIFTGGVAWGSSGGGVFDEEGNLVGVLTNMAVVVKAFSEIDVTLPSEMMPPQLNLDDSTIMPKLSLSRRPDFGDTPPDDEPTPPESDDTPPDPSDSVTMMSTVRIRQVPLPHLGLFKAITKEEIDLMIDEMQK